MFRTFFGVIIALLFSTVTFPQTNLTDLQKQLPQLIQNNPELLQQVTKTLERDITLNPKIVAYRIKYYEAFFNDGIKDNNLNGLNNLKLITAYFYKERNKWIENEINKISVSNFNENYKNQAINFLEDYFTEITDNLDAATLDLNKNLTEYYTSIALGKDDLGNYDESTDYSKVKRTMEEIVLERYKNSLKRLVDQGPMDVSDVQIINYWYIFNEDNKDQSAFTTTYLLNYFKSAYSTKNLKLNSLLLGPSFFFLEEKGDVKFNQPTNSTEINLISIRKKAQLDLQFKHKFVLSDELKTFSFIDLGISASLFLTKSLSGIGPKMVYERTPEVGEEYISQTWTFTKLSIEKNSGYSTLLKISTPIVFYTSDFYLEFGCEMGFDFYSYDLNAEYAYGKVEVVWDANQQRFIRNILEQKPLGTTNESKTVTNFIILPVFDLTYQSYNPIVFQFSASYNFVSAKVGYIF